MSALLLTALIRCHCRFIRSEWRVFDFGPNAIGTIVGPALKDKEARGAVYEPSDVPLTIRIDAREYPAVFARPELFDQIGKDEFCGLVLKGQALLEDDEEAILSKSTDYIVGRASQWSKLQSIALDSMPVNEAALSALNNLKDLRALRLSQARGLDCKELGRSPFLKKLKDLSLYGLHADEVLCGVEESQLVNLFLGPSTVSARAIARLSRWQHLENLQLEEKVLDDRVLSSLVRLHLKRLTLVGIKPTPAQLRLCARGYPMTGFIFPSGILLTIFPATSNIAIFMRPGVAWEDWERVSSRLHSWDFHKGTGSFHHSYRSDAQFQEYCQAVLSAVN